MGKELLDINKLRQVHSGAGEPLLAWKWYLRAFPDIAGKTLPTSYCEEVGLPFAQFNQNTKEIAATTLNLPGTSSIDSFEITVFEDQKLSAMDYFLTWKHLVQNPLTGGYNVPAVYWRNLPVTLMNTKNEDIGTSTVYNVWPISISNLALSQENNRVRLNIQMACTAQILRVGQGSSVNT